MSPTPPALLAAAEGPVLVPASAGPAVMRTHTSGFTYAFLAMGYEDHLNRSHAWSDPVLLATTYPFSLWLLYPG